MQITDFNAIILETDKPTCEVILSDLIQLKERIWYYPPAKNTKKIEPAIGVIITAAGTVLVDAGNSVQHAERVQAALDAIYAPPVTHLIYTHRHWDHILGAQFWSNAEVIAHQTCAAYVAEMCNTWGPAYLHQRGEKFPSMRGVYMLIDTLVDWDTFQIIEPSIVFEETRMTFTHGGLDIVITHVGGAHADDSTVVCADNVIFLGDSYYPPAGPSFDPANKPDYAMLRRFLDEGYEWFVDGHREATTAATMRRFLEGRA